MTLSEGIVKINSRTLEASELKKFDKLEKEGIALTGAVTKGKTSTKDILFTFLKMMKFDIGPEFLSIIFDIKILKHNYPESLYELNSNFNDF